MFFVYVLFSKKDSKLYIGLTNNLKRRYKEHQQGLVISTKNRLPLNLVYYETYTSKKDAAEREQKLKQFSGIMTHLRNRLKNSIMLFK